MYDTFTVTEFKAKCLDIFDRLSDHRLTRVTVTRRGKQVAVIMSPSSTEDDIRALHGSMTGMVLIPSGFDLTAPAMDEALDAVAGVLHR